MGNIVYKITQYYLSNLEWTEALNVQSLVWVLNGRGCAKHCWVVVDPSSSLLHAVMRGEHAVFPIANSQTHNAIFFETVSD